MDDYNEITTKELVQRYYAEFKNDTRLPELFELIEEDKLRKWIIDQFESTGGF